ncbi:hypothetical protein [Wolbachia endosymbiont (group A) of Agelastica alni]|uniref:hypothetical protein n=1 Tax=Wolbachia endosymbiont (group A) of Agelastica alni TaxID=3066130 RepID=UPI003132D883
MPTCHLSTLKSDYLLLLPTKQYLIHTFWVRSSATWMTEKSAGMTGGNATSLKT